MSNCGFNIRTSVDWGTCEVKVLISTVQIHGPQYWIRNLEAILDSIDTNGIA